MPDLSQLNPRQKAAVKHLEGPLLVLAGAGSGKTRVIAHKIAHLLDRGMKAHHIAAVTFTNKAAREMRSRVAELTGGTNTRGLRISTFHTLGLNIIRQERERLGYRSGFSIFDAEDQLNLVRELLRKTAASEGVEAPRVLTQISRWKSKQQDPEEAAAGGDGEPWQAAAAGIYADYEVHLQAYNAVDFDDLIGKPIRLFHQHAEALGAWQERIRYLLVDEYQDTNSAQYELMRLLVGNRVGLSVVGDDDQSIYAWRGAEPRNLLQLQEDFSGLTVVKLEQNYRSMGRILKAANHLIAYNPHVFEKRLWSQLGFGDPIRVVRARNEEHEAERVVAELLSHRFKHRTAYGDYAILYRGNHQSRPFEKALREHRVPYFLSGGPSFFSYTEVKDLMGYMRLLANPDDDAAFLRVINTPRREIGPATLEKLSTYAAGRGISLFTACFELGLSQHLSAQAMSRLSRFSEWLADLADRAQRGDPVAVVKELIQGCDYEDHLKDNCKDLRTAERCIGNVWELVAWMQRLLEEREDKESLADVVAHMSLMDVLERQGEERAGDCVHLMTLHGAKGLEFPHVFLAGMEEGLLPHYTAVDAGDVAEERRLAYVGMTRAQRSLTCTLAAQRKRQGEWMSCEPSRFLAELPEDDLKWEGAGQQQDPEERQARGQAYLANLRDMLG